MEFLTNYAGFLLKTLTVLVACVIVIIVPFALRSREDKSKGKIRVKSLNKALGRMGDALAVAMMSKEERKAHKKAEKNQSDDSQKGVSNVFVVDFKGDIRASAVDSLRNEVSTILANAKTTDEVVVRLESPGGSVDGYGLASSQLARLRSAGIPLTVCVDNVAASGGYMMACVADKILSAPFAVLGSIGVVAQLPNFHRLLKKHDVDFEVFTAGEYKRTMTTMGENTEENRKKFKQELEAIHTLFKSHVGQYRPALDMDAVATGESWFGTDALARKLSDEIMISDDYLTKLAQTRNLYHVSYEPPRKGGLKKRLGMASASIVDAVIDRALTRLALYRGY